MINAKCTAKNKIEYKSMIFLKSQFLRLKLNNQIKNLY
jgi:hypothetical protein